MADGSIISTGAVADLIVHDDGLRASNTASANTHGAEAATALLEMLKQAIEATKVGADGLISEADVRAISDYIRANPTLLARFVELHGDDENNETTGYHLVQNNGGTQLLNGANLIDTVIDSLNHFGFQYTNTNILNEDGNANATLSNLATYINTFALNKANVIGTQNSETIDRTGTTTAALGEARNETIYAYGGSDTVYTGDGADVVYGGDGADYIVASDSVADEIYGDAGNDTINAGSGKDSLYGGGDNDTIYGNAGDDAVDGGAGADQLYGGDGNDVMTGGDGNDYMLGDAGNDTLAGGAGADQIYGGAGDDIINAADDATADTVNGDAGNDTLYLGAGDSGNGGTGDDTFFAGAGSKVYADGGYYGDGGSDTIVLTEKSIGAPIEVHQFTNYRDRIDLSKAGLNAADFEAAISITQSGADTIVKAKNYDVTVILKSFNAKQLTKADFIFADQPAQPVDRIGASILNDDGLRAAISSANIADGAAAASEIIAILRTAMQATGVGLTSSVDVNGVKTLSDYIRSNADLNARFIAAHGDDEGGTETGYHLVQNDGGTQTFNGDNLINTVLDSLFHIGFKYTATNILNEDGNANATLNDMATYINYFVRGQNDVIGTDNSETINRTGATTALFGDAQNGAIHAYGGNDSIYAGDGADVIYGGDGGDYIVASDSVADEIYGEAGNDTIAAGSGNDKLSGGDGVDTINGNDGDDAVDGGNGDDQLYGGAGNDVMTGGDGNDYMVGGAGADTLTGGAGKDTLTGGDGDDIIKAADDATADTVSGDAGNDAIYLGAGDTGTGGAGDDTFTVSGAATVATGTGLDVIGFAANANVTVTDFQNAQDRFNLAGTGLSFDDLVIYQQGGNTVIEASDSTITLLNTNARNIDSADFINKSATDQTPIVFDLNGDGHIGVTGETSSYDKSGVAGLGRTVSFDLNADGVKEQIEWVDGSGDGLLVDMTRIGANGEIDGSALFGDQGGAFANGYDKLAQLDANGDGKLAGDELADLQIWVDNGDAVLQQGELKSLADLGVTEISTKMGLVAGADGRALMQSTATTADGSLILTEDVWFGGADTGDEAVADAQAADHALADLAHHDQPSELCAA